MNIGDLVKIKDSRRMIEYPYNFGGVGIIIDVYETDFDTTLEVRFEYDRGWFNIFELELISESR
ncbi:MAG: hypothetical protein CMI54_02625 [Parcubacteria group bacterium]|nr:hypothetical protein [Parcubacteria group bacterium]|tara:strand:- start:975 stop:1166 length:192 start_codon:yes stop_codon:yes gene_type:complete